MATPCNVLWADDDAADGLCVLATILRSKGLSVTICGNYQEAKEILDQHHVIGRPFDVIMIDILLARSSGEATLGAEVGIALAKHAVRNRMCNRIVFLSVRAIGTQMSMNDEIEKIGGGNGVSVAFRDKMALLDPGAIEALVRDLRGASGQEVP